MENVLTVGLQQASASSHAMQASMEELAQLVETAGGQIVERHVQKRDRPDPATFIGRGKVLELAERVQALHVRTVIFDDELKPVQQRNLEETLNAKVVDRTRLILDIFAQRARTREGILQVELAQLEYLLPRMTARFGRFEQQTGGIGTRGPGERKLEVDRRRIRDRLAYLKKQIAKIQDERHLQRRVRGSIPMPQVSLVGYTNAGKSTLLNHLLDIRSGGSSKDVHHVYADDKLFATLDPTTRRIKMPSGRFVLFSDTVGFIRKLPTELIAAFRATLEELRTADLLLLVVDASDPEHPEQEQTVLGILHDLKVDHLPRLTAYNKMDRLSLQQQRPLETMESILISAETGQGVSELLARIHERLAAQWVERDLLIAYSKGALLSQLYPHIDILSQTHTSEGIRLRVRGHPSTLAQWLPKSSVIS